MTTVDPERLLRSRLGQVGLVLALVGLASLATTYQFDVMMEARGRPFDFTREWQRQALQWGLWGLAAWPVAILAGGLWRAFRPWPLALLLTAILSLGLGWGHATLTTGLVEAWAPFAERSLAQGALAEGSEARRLRRPEFPAGASAPQAGLGPLWGVRGERGPPPGARGARLPRSVVQSWLLLGLIAGGQAFLARRRDERRAAAAELAAASAREHLTAVRLEVLRGQVHPHFLFNALHAVGGLVREGEGQQALRTLASLSDLLRSSLDLGGEELVTLGAELALVQRYVEIETIRFGERLGWRCDIDDDARSALVPSLLLLPLVENAVRYAVEPRAEGGRVLLSGRLVDDALILELRDDGPGFSETQLAGGTLDDGASHLGLSSTRERLRMIYGEGCRFELGQADGRRSDGSEGAGDGRGSAGSGALVRLELPAGGAAP